MQFFVDCKEPGRELTLCWDYRLCQLCWGNRLCHLCWDFRLCHESKLPTAVAPVKSRSAAFLGATDVGRLLA